MLNANYFCARRRSSLDDFVICLSIQLGTNRLRSERIAFLVSRVVQFGSANEKYRGIQLSLLVLIERRYQCFPGCFKGRRARPIDSDSGCSRGRAAGEGKKQQDTGKAVSSDIPTPSKSNLTIFRRPYGRVLLRQKCRIT